ncbi:MAG TPA: glycosyltransferase [Polyangiaceae bacterium]|nr:glycosyltransferase [Polyangiaceae bacterium]
MTAADGAVDVSVVIPAFDEAERIPQTLRELAGVLAAAPQRWAWEIVVSDDGSTDGTAEASARAGLPAAALRVVRSARNRGKGHAVRAGMLAARGGVRVMADADASMPATELPELVGPVARGEADVVVGSRYAGGGHARGQSPLRRAWSRVAHRLTGSLVPGVRDLHCGYKAFGARAAEDVFGRATVDRWGFDLEILALALRRGHRVLEVPIAWNDAGRSRVRARDFPQTAWEVLRLWRRLKRER